MSKRKHETPEWMDDMFERLEIEPWEYASFWESFWQLEAKEEPMILRVAKTIWNLFARR